MHFYVDPESGYRHMQNAIDNHPGSSTMEQMNTEKNWTCVTVKGLPDHAPFCDYTRDHADNLAAKWMDKQPKSAALIPDYQKGLVNLALGVSHQ